MSVHKYSGFAAWNKRGVDLKTPRARLNESRR